MLRAMTKEVPLRASQGPFRSDQICSGDPYELSNGHAIHRMPSGGRRAQAIVVGAGVLSSDPAVDSAGLDAGFSPTPKVLRAPDIAVGGVPASPGWIQGAPPLAVQYADSRQDEADLVEKIADLLTAGTQIVWIVRLMRPQQVEIHRPGEPMRLAQPGDELTAPGILANPVPVEALYDAEVGRRAMLRNLLQREGYDSLEAVRSGRPAVDKAKGLATGEVNILRESIREVLTVRGLGVGDAVDHALSDCADPETLRRWHRQALLASTTDEILFSP
jgi:hypothetical protein